MEIIGNIIGRKPAEQKTENFKVQIFQMDCGYVDNYTQQQRENYLEFQVSNANIDKIAAIPDGSRVKVYFNPRGRFYDKQDGTKAIAQNLDAWKFELISAPNIVKDERTYP